MKRQNKIQTIKLEPYDDVISIRDRLQFVEMPRVLLILPPQGRLLQRKLDLLLLQREATRRCLHLALLTTDPTIMEHAAEINLSVFTTTRQARARRWKQAHNQVFEDRYRPKNSPHAYELMGVASRLKSPLTAAQRRRRRMGQGMVGAFILTAIMAALLALFPSATVTITPATDAISEPFTIMADPNVTQIDVLSNSVPAQILTQVFPGSTVTVEATGRRDAEDSLAEGSVIFTNQSGEAIFIPRGTVVRTDDTRPARFQTTSDVALPASNGATVEVGIAALPDTSGLKGNVAPDAINRIEGVLEAQASVRNPQATFGGGIVQEAIVTTADHERLLTLARQAVEQSARSELLLQMPTQDKFLIPDSVRVIEERPEWKIYSADVGEAVESVSLDMRALVQAVVIDDLQVRQLAFILLSRRLPDNREINESALTYRREVQQVDAEGRIQLQVFLEGNSYYAVDTSALAGRISGMSIGEAQRTLENELLLDPRYPPQISTRPFSLGRLPFIPVRIEIVVNRS